VLSTNPYEIRDSSFVFRRWAKVFRGLERHVGEQLMTEFTFLGELSL